MVYDRTFWSCDNGSSAVIKTLFLSTCASGTVAVVEGWVTGAKGGYLADDKDVAQLASLRALRLAGRWSRTPGAPPPIRS